MQKDYLPRIADKALGKALAASGAVLIEGPKWCGKTRTALQKAKSVLSMQNPDEYANNMRIAETKPSLLFDGDVPRLLDEWQTAPVLWDAVRFMVDRRGEKGQFILTGSAVPLDNATLHTGTGRIARLKMRTMTLFESQDSNGKVSLQALFDGQGEVACKSELTIEALAYVLTRGGWPESVGESEDVAQASVAAYVDAVINYDVSRVDGVEKNPHRVLALLKSYARNISTMAANTTIAADMSADDSTIAHKTIASYLNALERIHVVEDLPAWNPSMRSKTALRTSAKRHFSDPSIAVSVLSASSKTLLKDFNTFGLLFESLCIRDLRVYSQALGGEVFHYRDKNGLEADAVVHLKDGRWCAVEVKMGNKEIEEAAVHLSKLREVINTEKMREPSFLMVLTAGQYAYRRPDGVYVVPIGCLKD
jgi:predicted AAA+ superfamily ATPase